jgi:hypothetical protein
LNNIQSIWSTGLAEAGGDRTAERPRQIIDETIGPMTQTYVDHPEDRTSQLAIMRLLREYRDIRALPAFIAGLDWRVDSTEQHAILAAQALRDIDVPEDRHAEVIAALDEAIQKVRDARSITYTLRLECVRALGSLASSEATPVLVRVATRSDEDQTINLNYQAALQIARQRDPAAAPGMVNGLFVYQAGQPGAQMADVAINVLVQLGRASYEPLTQALAGDNADLNRLAGTWRQAATRAGVRGLAPVGALVRERAALALGQLGFPDAYDLLAPMVTPLTELPLGRDGELRDPDAATTEIVSDAMNGMGAIMQLNLSDEQHDQAWALFQQVWPRVGTNEKRRLIGSTQMLYDRETYDFLFEVVNDSEADAQTRRFANAVLANLADGAMAARLAPVYEREAGPDEVDMRPFFQEMNPALAVAQECDLDAECYRRHLADDDDHAAQKSAYMLAMIGRGQEGVIDDLVAQLDNTDVQRRQAVILAIDHVARDGSEAAVERIARMAEEEEGNRSWIGVRDQAMRTMGRLRSRGS